MAAAILIILLGVILVLILILLFMPLIIRIDTVTDTYDVRLKGIIRLQLIPINGLPGLKLEMPFFTREFDLTKQAGKTKSEQKPKAKKATEKKSRGPSFTPGRLQALVRTFHIKQLYVSLDTGDYVKNALLVPIFQWVDHYRNRLEVNFNGDTIIRFVASNNIWRLGITYLRTAS